MNIFEKIVLGVVVATSIVYGFFPSAYPKLVLMGCLGGLSTSYIVKHFKEIPISIALVLYLIVFGGFFLFLGLSWPMEHLRPFKIAAGLTVSVILLTYGLKHKENPISNYLFFLSGIIALQNLLHLAGHYLDPDYSEKARYLSYAIIGGIGAAKLSNYKTNTGIDRILFIPLLMGIFVVITDTIKLIF